jgi:Adenylate and Guanylate cyclase catalytic domain
MNMAARMESTGARNQIHISSETAKLLIAAGKSSWIVKRKEQVDVKGKGLQDTYWVKLGTSSSEGSVRSGRSGSAMAEEVAQSERLADAQKQTEANYIIGGTSNALSKKIERLVDWNTAVLKQRLIAIQTHRNGTDTIDEKVEEQLRQHVAGIASMYRNNTFHNFEVRVDNSRDILLSCVRKNLVGWKLTSAMPLAQSSRLRNSMLLT